MLRNKQNSIRKYYSIKRLFKYVKYRKYYSIIIILNGLMKY